MASWHIQAIGFPHVYWIIANVRVDLGLCFLGKFQTNLSGQSFGHRPAMAAEFDSLALIDTHTLWKCKHLRGGGGGVTTS